jgi:thioesterase domain-containing protein
MRIMVAMVLLVGGCRFFKPAQQPQPVSEQQRWDDFCRNPPDGNWAAWCAQRAQQRQVEISQQALDEQRQENARAEKQRRFERSQAVSKAFQAPYNQKGD